MNANKHFRLRGLEFLKDDLAQLQQAVQDNNQEEIQKLLPPNVFAAFDGMTLTID